MKANQVRIRLNPDTGRMWLFKQPAAGRASAVADITDDVLSLFAMDALVRDDGQAVVQEIELKDGDFTGLVEMTIRKVDE